MNLIIDIGNTSAKVAIYDKHTKVFTERLPGVSREEIKRCLKGYKIQSAIISSVKGNPESVSEMLGEITDKVHILSHRSRLPFGTDYETPESMGTDRIAGVAGAMMHFKKRNLLVIDSGTAITFDYLLGNIFHGGNISPGIGLRLKALNQFTDKLPLVEISTDFRSPGKTTRDAILAGVINGVVYEINEYIRTFKKEQENAGVILTGGDAVHIKDRLSVKADYLPDLVTDGLNFILEYNAK